MRHIRNKIEEKEDLHMISVDYDGRTAMFTVFGDFSEGEVTSVMDDIGQERINDISRRDEPGLFEIIRAVNALLSPRVNDISID